MRPTGIFIHECSRPLPSGAKAFRLAVWRDEDNFQMHLLYRVGVDARAVLKEFLLAQRCSPPITWIAGSGATKGLAKAFKLEFRQRAPGGGRRPIAQEDQVRRFPLWMTPAGIKNLKRLSKRSGRSYGQEVEHWLPKPS